ncbi:MAG: helix-turn-helix domain-containing protein [Halapricum sp.]
MTVVTDLTIAGSELEFGQSLTRLADGRIRFDQLVPTGTGVFPYIWVNTGDHSAFVDSLEDVSNVESVSLVQLDDDEGLYRVEWADELDGFLGCLRDDSTTVVYARGSADEWKFQLRFDSHDAVARFQQDCADRDINHTIDRVVSGTIGNTPEDMLSERQRETVELALEKGYFDVPRKTTMVELAEDLDISDQAVSARLRRAMKTVCESVLSENDRRSKTKSKIRERP